MFLPESLWKVARVVGQAGSRDPVDQSSAESRKGGGVTDHPKPITEAKAEFKRKLAEVPLQSSSARMEMLGVAAGVDIGRGGRYEGVRRDLEGILAKIDSCVEEEADGAVETEEQPVLVNVFNSLDDEGEGYIETVEGGDGGGDQVFSHFGARFTAE